MKEINKNLLKAEIEKGVYSKKTLSETLGIAKGTLDKFFKSEDGKELADLRQSKRPNLKENGRKEYVANYNATYVREPRTDYYREYERKRRAKAKAEKEAQEIALVSPNEVKVGKVDKTGFSDSIAANQIKLKL